MFRLDLMLHACKIPIRCDSFEILNFATKQGHSKQKLLSPIYTEDACYYMKIPLVPSYRLLHNIHVMSSQFSSFLSFFFPFL